MFLLRRTVQSSNIVLRGYYKTLDSVFLLYLHCEIGLLNANVHIMQKSFRN
jgi:hypothetical protein